MATVDLSRTIDATNDNPSSKRRTSRRGTSHLKIVPDTKVLRESIRQSCIEVASRMDKSHPPGNDELESVSRQLLQDFGYEEGFLGWTMVALTAAFWHDQIAAVPYERRLFLLPHCLKHAEGCPADYDEFGLDCRQCGACSIADFRTAAEDLGYRVLVAEGSPIVLKIIVSGYVDAIVGVACLNVLEKAIDKLILAGIPCMAVPLLSSDCRNTSVDEDWVSDMIQTPHITPTVQTKTYVHLLRKASNMFQGEELTRLIPPLRSKSPRPIVADISDPIAGTENLAIDFLRKGGKYSRPFITLAVHDALTGGAGMSSTGAAHLDTLPDALLRAAMSIEIFHKASLIHDDIEDDDSYRYGEETLHRKYGLPTAINVGDYMIGLGYRLVTREIGDLGAEVVADILDHLADAHLKLSEGQGAELLWRDSHDKNLTPLDALKIYALKTAPAFEAALYTGLRLAGPTKQYDELLPKFARNLGVAFQILNDLKDWQENEVNKVHAGGDILGGRPTLLWALALDLLDKKRREELLALATTENPPTDCLHRVKAIYESAGIFEKAHALVDKYKQRAESLADDVEPDDLRRLLYYLIDSVLDRPRESSPQIITPQLHGVAPLSPPSEVSPSTESLSKASLPKESPSEVSPSKV